MRILVIESYYGGSHKAFIDGWIKHSEHQFDLVTFPPYKWKWRMRHTAVSAAKEVEKLVAEGKEWDLLFVSDMLGLAEFIGLAPAVIATLPRIAYFHENQLTYPDNSKGYRDMHYPFINFTTAVSADQVWFNTAWHREEFLGAVGKFLRRMPDYRHLEEIQNIREKSAIFGQGIYESKTSVKNAMNSDTLKLTWAARWEHDKNPEDLYKVLVLLRKKGVAFKLNVIGESFNKVPEIFEEIKNEFSEYIDRFGYQPTREDYIQALAESDMVISTAIHEFFGVSVIEGCACGAVPVAPERLAYPEVLCGREEFLYDNTPKALCAKIMQLNLLRGTQMWEELRSVAQSIAGEYYWEKISSKMDEAAQGMV